MRGDIRLQKSRCAGREEAPYRQQREGTVVGTVSSLSRAAASRERDVLGAA
jgi:hypothetical protein